MISKHELRKIYRQKRMELHTDRVKRDDQAILAQLCTLDFSTVQFLHLYLPIHRWNEFDTGPFAAWLRKEHPHINLVISRSDMETGTLRHYRWDEVHVPVENAWGIPELLPDTAAQEIFARQIDLVIVPLLVADNLGNRIGYGKGFYDRFLSECRDDCRTVGVSYFPPLGEAIEADSWDIPLDLLVVPDAQYLFRKK